MRYLDADTIADAKNAYGCQVPLDNIAGHLQVSVAELRHVLNLPPLVEAKTVNVECDLWRVVEAEGQL